MQSRPRLEVVLLVILTIDLVLGLCILVAGHLDVWGPPAIAVVLLLTVFALGLAAAISMLLLSRVGPFLGTLFYGMQILSADHDGRTIGASWGLAVNFRIWTEAQTQVCLNLWALVLCIAFLFATAGRHARQLTTQQAVAADRADEPRSG